MIVPTIGRILWYWPVTGEKAGAEGLKRFDEAQPLPGLVVHIWPNGRVNLTVFDALGYAVCITTDIHQEGQPRPPDGGFAEWVPQSSGAAKSAFEMAMAGMEVGQALRSGKNIRHALLLDDSGKPPKYDPENFGVAAFDGPKA